MRCETAARVENEFLWDEYLLDLLDADGRYRCKIIAANTYAGKTEFELRVLDPRKLAELSFPNLEKELGLPEGELTTPVKQLGEEDEENYMYLTTSDPSWGIHSTTTLYSGVISDHDFQHYVPLVEKVQEALSQAVGNTIEFLNSDEYTESVIEDAEWEFDLDTGRIY